MHGTRDVLHSLGALPGGEHLADESARDRQCQQRHDGDDYDKSEMGTVQGYRCAFASGVQGKHPSSSARRGFGPPARTTLDEPTGCAALPGGLASAASGCIRNTLAGAGSLRSDATDMKALARRNRSGV
ncbi:hypothetical protein Mro03_14400 [Microbispora rosea subsp. rosea]|nr:hypothetical protein Mro03_14400 [Microbispora rosea subsp. rosea]